MKGAEEHKAPDPTPAPLTDAGQCGEFQGEAPTDKQGLEKVYAQGDTYIRGDTLYAAGSHTARDWCDDATEVPFWGDARGAERYQAAEKVLNENPNVKRVVGHSLGGSVALELQKRHKGLASRTYGAPVWGPFREGQKEVWHGGELSELSGPREILKWVRQQHHQVEPIHVGVALACL